MKNGITVHGVLAGAYKAGRLNLKATLTHASADGALTALCKRVKDDSLCDVVEPGEPTCPTCLARYRKVNS